MVGSCASWSVLKGCGCRWLWRLRADRQFVLSYVSKKVPTVRETLFGKALNDILFSNELVALYPVAKVCLTTATSHTAVPYLALHSCHLSSPLRDRSEALLVCVLGGRTGCSQQQYVRCCHEQVSFRHQA